MATHFSVTVSDDGRVELDHALYSLKLAVVSDKNARALAWNHAGIYILLGLVADGGWCAYVGKSTDLSKRIAQPHESIEWSRALLVCRPGSHFDTAEIGWLEGRLHGLLETGGVDLRNRQTPGDDTLSERRQETLEHYVGSIQSALTLLGYSLGPPQQATRHAAEAAQQDAEPTTAGKVHGKLLGYLPVGTVIKSTTSKYRGATAKVEATGILYGAKLYTSPSAAAKAVTGTDTADGLAFWGVEDKAGKVSKLRDVRDGKVAIQRQRKTTPSKLTAAKRKRLFARHDEGATYVELQREFGMSQGGVYKVLKEGGRVRAR